MTAQPRGGKPSRTEAPTALRHTGRRIALVLLAIVLVGLVTAPRTAAAETSAPPANDPYRMIVMLQVRLPRGEMTCTGFMVGPHTVATAAHCLFNRDMGGWASGASVTPGLDGTTAPFGTVWATSFAVSPTWVDTQDLSEDYGAITLASDTLGASTGWFEVTVPSDFTLATGQYQTAGYGSTAQYGTLWRMQGTQPVANYDQDFIAYQWGTSSGESGAPIFSTVGARHRAIGLLKGAHGPEDNRQEYAVRVDARIVDFYREQVEAPRATAVEQQVPTIFMVPASSEVTVSSPATLVNAESVLQSSTDLVRWTTIASGRTDAHGVATYRINPTEPMYYRVVVRGAGAGRAARGLVTASGSGSGVRGTFAVTPTFASSRVVMAVFQGGTTDQLNAAIAAAGAVVALVTDRDGVQRMYLPGGGSLNDGFLAAFPDGIPPATSVTLIAAS